MSHTLSLYNLICQLYLNKTGGKELLFVSETTILQGKTRYFCNALSHAASFSTGYKCSIKRLLMWPISSLQNIFSKHRFSLWFFLESEAIYSKEI